MNIKSYLKGIGVGILVSALILIIAGNMNKMSDADVIKRAKELGMVEANAEIQNTVPANEAKENTVTASDNSATAANTTETYADDKTAQNTSDTNNTNEKVFIVGSLGNNGFEHAGTARDRQTESWTCGYSAG